MFRMVYESKHCKHDNFDMDFSVDTIKEAEAKAKAAICQTLAVYELDIVICYPGVYDVYICGVDAGKMFLHLR